MAFELVAEAGRVLVGALIGGAITAATALPMMNTKLAKLTTEVVSMKESCTTCKTGLDKAVDTLTAKVDAHHEDDDRHYTKASDKLLNDILTRVMRIETRMFSGRPHPED